MASVIKNENELECPEVNPYSNTIEPLSRGLLQTYQPALSQTQTQLKELIQKQSDLLEQVHSENLTLSKTQHSTDLQEMFKKIEIYQAKLVGIKKDMKHIHDKSTKLKKRALRIQQVKEKQENIMKQKELEIKKEQDLINKQSTNIK